MFQILAENKVPTMTFGTPLVQVFTCRVTHSNRQIAIGPINKNNHKQGYREGFMRSRVELFPAINSINGKTSVFPCYEAD